MDFKKIKIGECIENRVKELDIPMERICNFLKIDANSAKEMFAVDELSTKVLLRWCKLLEYDFFRLYSQYLVLYAPPASLHLNIVKEKPSLLPRFRKNLYTREIIEFILELLETDKKTKLQIMREYKIPKSTLNRWIDKYRKNTNDE